MRISDLRRMEVINTCDCRRLGFVSDVCFDPCSGRIEAIVVPGTSCMFGFLGKEKELVIPYQDICRFGDDIILVRIRERNQ